MDNNGSNFYFGRQYDLVRQALADKLVLYDPTDLTTHAVITGDGSGKTGMGIILLEENPAGIPAI